MDEADNEADSCFDVNIECIWCDYAFWRLLSLHGKEAVV